MSDSEHLGQYNRDYFEGRTSFFYSFGGYRDVNCYFNRLGRWFLPYVGQGPVLDFGCGYGFLLARFDDGRDLAGCDVSEWALSQAALRLPRARFARVEPGGRLPYADGSFGAVISTDVIEHIPFERQPQVLGEVARVLAPGGRFCMTTPNPSRLRRFFYGGADGIEGHIGMRRVDDWARLLEQHGLKPCVTWTYLHGFFPGRCHWTCLPECALVAEKA
jgi:SAM-dependent methyltransferase